MIPGPQVVKTHIRPSETLSPAAQQATIALQLRTAGKFNEGEASLEEIMGAMLAAAAWIAHHHNAVFAGADDPRH